MNGGVEQYVVKGAGEGGKAVGVNDGRFNGVFVCVFFGVSAGNRVGVAHNEP
jgi:hypothetical protein